MSGFFNVENGFFQVVGKIVDMAVISIIYIILCIPIITIGPATTALYYTMVKVIRRERSYAYKEFFKCFKANFKSGAFLTILFVAAYFILYVDREYAISMIADGNKIGIALYCVFNALGIALICTTVYIFPVLSRFTLKGLNAIKTAFFMAIRHLPTTILVAAVVLLTMMGTYVILPGFIIIPSIGCLLCSFLLERVFKKYTPQSVATSEDVDEDVKDTWYLE